MRHVKNFTFLIYLMFCSFAVTSQVIINCNEEVIQSDRILQDDIVIAGIEFAAYSESDKVRNACGGANGIRLVFSTRSQIGYGQIDATILLSSNSINYNFVSSIGLSNVVNANGNFSGDFTFSNQENGCAEVLISLPEVNHYGDNQIKAFIEQVLYVTIQNHTTATQTSNSFTLYDDDNFENYYHFYNNVTADDYFNSFTSIANGQSVLNSPTLNYFHGDFIINEDFDLFKGSDTGDPDLIQYFDNNSKVIVQNGYLLDIRGNHLTSCPTKTWDGIKVLDGGEIEFEKSWGSKAKTVLETNNNSIVRIFDSRIFNSDKGMLINGSTQLTNFTNNKLEDLGIGVHLAGNASNIKLTPLDITKPNIFKNITQSGIYSSSATDCEVMFNKFENIAVGSNQGSSNAAIRSENSSLLIAKNEIKNCSKGTYSLADKKYIVSDNDFIDNTLGARIRHNKDLSSIKSNTITGKNGVQYSYAFPHIDDNFINNDGNYPTESYGIQGNYSFFAAIRDNNINSSDATGALVLNNSTGLISSNDISLLSQNDIAGIRLNGGDGSYVASNVIEAAGSSGTESFGVVSSASGANDITCNDIFQLEEAIVAEDNSMSIDIKTNNMFSLGTGIKLEHSIIGEQKHNGNIFLGSFTTADIFAIEMTPGELFNSKFIVDGAENILFVPQVVAANGNLVDNFNDPALTESCNGAVYTTTPKDRLLSLCNIIKLIQNNATMDAVRKKHIMSYYFKLILKYFPDKTKWPLCIKTFMDTFKNTNIEKMGEVSLKMTALLTPPQVNSTAKNNHDNALNSYLTDVKNGQESSQSRTAYYQSAAILSAEYPDRSSEISSLNVAIENVLGGFTPSDDYEAAWLELHTSLLKSYKDEELSSAEKSGLETLASLCPLQFGDIVHGARALLSEWSDVRYDFTDCEADSELRSSKKNHTNSSFVSPNPTSSKIIVNIVGETAIIAITDVNGKNVINSSIKKGEFIDLSYLHSGLYFVSIIEMDGMIKSDKFIKIE